MTKIGIISDIHGNYNALRAVVEDAENQGIKEYWLLGDILLPGPGTRELMDLLYQLPITIKIKGNWDDFFLDILDGSKIDDATDMYLARLSQYLLETLTCKDIDFIRNMPLRMRKNVGGITFSITHNQIDKNWGGALTPISGQKNFDNLFDDDTDVAIYAHVHHQMMRYDTKDRLIINTGTVGQPFSFCDKLNKDKRAQYVILEVDDQSRLDVRFKKVDYDTKSEIKLAKQKKLPYFELYKEQIETGKTYTHDLDYLKSINQKYNYENDVINFLKKLESKK